MPTKTDKPSPLSMPKSNPNKNGINIADFETKDLILIMKKEQVQKIEKAYKAFNFRNKLRLVMVLNRIKRSVVARKRDQASKSIQYYLRKFL